MFFSVFFSENWERGYQKRFDRPSHVFSWVLCDTSVLLNGESWKSTSILNSLGENIRQKKKAIKFRSQRLHSKK